MRLVTAPRKGNRGLVTVSDMQYHTTDVASGGRPQAENLVGHPCLVPDNAVCGCALGDTVVVRRSEVVSIISSTCSLLLVKILASPTST
jgi:hypothetical protein